MKKTIINKYRLIDYHERLMQELKDPQEARAYLNAALADEDQRVFLLALKNVIEANSGNISAVAKEAQLNRENLYRMLSKRGNPRLSSVRSVLGVVGLNLAVQPSHK